MRVVIADDEPIIRMDLREMLESNGYQVVAEAADGFDAVEACRKERPELVIIDVKMPLMDGLTASQIITGEQLAEAVVLLSAFSDREFIESAKKCGVSSYLVKPIDERSFFPALEIAVERSRDMKNLKNEYQTIANRLESRTAVERAKGVLMNSRGLSEQDAYDYIRNVSKTKNVSMKRIAEIILMRKEG